MELKQCKENKRLSAVGCDNGQLLVSMTDIKLNSMFCYYNISSSF